MTSGGMRLGVGSGTTGGGVVFGRPWHLLYFLPLPHGHALLRLGFTFRLRELNNEMNLTLGRFGQILGVNLVVNRERFHGLRRPENTVEGVEREFKAMR